MSELKKLDLALFVKKIMETEMGYVLDLARVSDMNDRQFVQFEKSVKTHSRNSMRNAITLLSEYRQFEVDMTVLQRDKQSDKSDKGTSKDEV